MEEAKRLGLVLADILFYSALLNPFLITVYIY